MTAKIGDMPIDAPSEPYNMAVVNIHSKSRVTMVGSISIHTAVSWVPQKGAIEGLAHLMY